MTFQRRRLIPRDDPPETPTQRLPLRRRVLDGAAGIQPIQINLTPTSRGKGDTAEVSALMVEWNDKYMLANDNGKVGIRSYELSRETDQHRFITTTKSDFQLLHANRRVHVGENANGDKVYKPAAEVWLHHPDRKTYPGGVFFNPSGVQYAGALNLWKDLAIEPKCGRWEKFYDHIWSVVCRHNKEHYDYLMNWMARLVQHPELKCRVAVVLQGLKGSGKGTLVQPLLRIFGRHGLHIIDATHLVGRFREHLRGRVLLFADEAFFAGDKQHIGVLKGLISEEQTPMEGKYKVPTEVRNFLHIIMASDQKWVVPAGLDERRFFCLEVSAEKKGDTAYFKAIEAELDDGGLEAFLYELKHRLIENFNPDEVPQTDALREQKQQSLEISDLAVAWWQDVLSRGFVLESKIGLHDVLHQWIEEPTLTLLHKSYLAFADQRRVHHRLLSRQTLGNWMKGELGAKQVRLGRAIAGETTQGGAAVVIREDRPRGYYVGPLKAARDHFDAKWDLGVDWDDDDEYNVVRTGNVTDLDTRRSAYRGLAGYKQARDDRVGQ
jgi:hypothetical protein